MDELRARMLLHECTGRDIWPLEWCRERGVPEAWLAELADTYESGFAHDRQTIYVDQRPTNQFHGVFDRHLAYKLGEYLGLDTARITAFALSPEAEVRAIREAAEE